MNDHFQHPLPVHHHPHGRPQHLHRRRRRRHLLHGHDALRFRRRPHRLRILIRGKVDAGGVHGVHPVRAHVR